MRQNGKELLFWAYFVCVHVTHDFACLLNRLTFLLCWVVLWERCKSYDTQLTIQWTQHILSHLANSHSVCFNVICYVCDKMIFVSIFVRSSVMMMAYSHAQTKPLPLIHLPMSILNSTLTFGVYLSTRLLGSLSRS